VEKYRQAYRYKKEAWKVNPTLIRVAVFFSILCIFSISCSKKDDTALIGELVEKAAKLAEAQDVKKLVRLTTETFLALPGRHDRQETKRILWLAFRHYGEFKILYPEPSIDAAKTSREATARVYFVIVRKDLSYLGLEELYKNPEAWLEEVGENADLYRLDLDFVKKDGDWLVKIAHLEPFRGLGFGR
jgi:hypothetical protein